jgi:hypothetical protein
MGGSDINDKMLSQALKAETQSRDIYPSLNYFRTDDLQSNPIFFNLAFFWNIWSSP